MPHTEYDDAMKLPVWRSHKLVRASKILAIRNLNIHAEAAFQGHVQDWDVASGHTLHIDQSVIRRNEPEVGDYFVLYEDGYRSWSPAAAFEGGYTQVLETPT